MKCLELMAPDEQIEHLLHVVAELTCPPVENDALLGTLTHQQHCIVGRMLRQEGEAVPHEVLWMAADVGGFGNGSDFIALLRVQICRARERLRKAGIPLVIESVWGFGYRAYWANK